MDTRSGAWGGESLDERAGQANTYEGGTGNDVIWSSTGTDLIIFNKGDGRDLLTTNGGKDLLSLNPFLSDGFTSAIAEAEVSFARSGLDLLVWIGRQPSDALAGEYVRVQNWFQLAEVAGTWVATQANSLGSVTLGNKVWTTTEITALALDVHGTDDTPDTLSGLAGYKSFLSGHGGDDHLIAVSALGDVLNGGAGSDTLQAHGPSVGGTFIFGRESGRDSLSLANTSTTKTDILRIEGGVTAADLSFTVQEDSAGRLDLLIGISGSTAQFVILDFLNIQGVAGTTMVDLIVFDDNTVLSKSDVVSRVQNAIIGTSVPDEYLYGNGYTAAIYGLAGNDRIIGSALAENIDGGLGDDTINGGAGGDILRGGGGRDTLNGDAGTDIIVGGAGNDIMDGGLGYDTYYGGDGDDTLGGINGSSDGTEYGNGGGTYVGAVEMITFPGR